MNINETDKAKAKSFIERLMLNPALKSFSLLQREEQIIQFLNLNARQLSPTLSSQAFFPGKSWEDICKILLAVLYEATNKDLLPEYNDIVSHIDLTFLSFLKPEAVNEQASRDTIRGLMLKSLDNEQARRSLTGSLAAYRYSIVKKFIGEIYRRKKYIHFEITKVERLRLAEKEAVNMVHTTIFLKPLIYLFAPVGISVKNTANGHVFLSQFTRNVANTLFEKAPAVPEQVFLSAMNANASFSENNTLEATARLGNIISAMCRNYKPEVKTDRGADSAIKSWINISRKNYKVYGYDIKMLDELYNIAADNGW